MSAVIPEMVAPCFEICRHELNNIFSLLLLTPHRNVQPPHLTPSVSSLRPLSPPPPSFLCHPLPVASTSNCHVVHLCRPQQGREPSLRIPQVVELVELSNACLKDVHLVPQRFHFIRLLLRQLTCRQEEEETEGDGEEGGRREED